MARSTPDGTLLKYPHSPERNEKNEKKSQQVMAKEVAIYTALGKHPRIVKYLGRNEHGLLFERVANGSVKNFLTGAGVFSDSPPGKPPVISEDVRLRWSRQAAEGMAYFHAHGVIHQDVHPNNVLLDEQLDLKWCDFAGSALGETEGFAVEAAAYCLLRDLDLPSNARSDIFALGSLFYFFMHGHHPYVELDPDEIEAHYARGEFADVSKLPTGDIIRACWTCQYESAGEVVQALDALKHSSAET